MADKWHTSIDNAQPTDYDDCQLHKIEGPPQWAERHLIRKWPDIAKTHADTIAAAEYAVDSYASPKADGQTYSGTWRNANVWTEDQGDGGVTIFQELIEGWIVQSGASPAVGDLPTGQLIEDEDRLFTPFGRDTTSVETTQVTKYRGIDPDYAQDLANEISQTSTLAAYSESGTPEVRITREQDGSASIWVKTVAKTWQNAANNDLYNWRSYSIALSLRPLFKKTFKWEKLSFTTAQAIAQTGPGSYVNPSDVTGFFNVHNEMDSNGDGTYWAKAHYVVFGYGDGSGGSDRITITGLVEEEVEKQHWPTATDGYRWRKIKYTYSIKYTTSGTSAKSFLNDGKTGSFIKYLGNGQWYVKKITTTTVGQWLETIYAPDGYSYS